MLASSLIPGNETAVFGVVNGLTRLGATVVHQGNAKVHVSGHASAGELLFLYNAVRPSNVMPVHGEWRHLRANAALAVRDRGAGGEVVLAEDGVVVDLVDGQARDHRPRRGRAACTSTACRSATSASRTLSDRLILGEGGFIAITVAVDSTTGRAVSRADDLRAAGSPTTPRRSTRCCRWWRRSCRRTEAEGITDTHRIAQSVRRVVGRWVADTYRRRPMIVPTVIPV